MDFPKNSNADKTENLGRDDPYSPNYDLSEEGFIRRNKNWADFSERFRENVRKGVAEFKAWVAANLKTSKLIREEAELIHTSP